MQITFQPLHESHFPLLLTWLEAPHVKRWWDRDVTYTMALIHEKYSSYIKGYKIEHGIQKPIQAFIIYREKNPVGYIQLYNAYDFLKSEQLVDLPANLGAFDIFIGEESVLGQNLGSTAIIEFLKLHCAQFAYIFVAPDVTNISAIKCYEKAGFKILSSQKETTAVQMLKATITPEC
ncbi:MAG: acetyltransferase [Gammaproteobacteria bacterium]|nr:acetyltransferase [Gammaproteobacteria bacterium]